MFASPGSTSSRRLAGLLCAFLAAFLLGAAQVRAQDPPQTPLPARPDSPAPAEPSSSGPPVTLFPHSKSSRFWISGQANFVLQWHPAFPEKYAGPLSFAAPGENALSRILTLSLGVQLKPYAEVLLQIESAGGKGLGRGFGLAAFTNLDVVHNPTLGSTPYIGRAMLHFVVPLTSTRISSERGPLSLATTLPRRRLELRFGKFQLVDFLDLNSAGSDSHLQFLNLVVDNNGAYDYAADTRGYTIGALADYEDRIWGLRFAEALMPREANGLDLQWNLSRARSENIEFELRQPLLANRSTVLRLLAFVNHANMGDYRQAIQQFQQGFTPVPEITNHPLRTASKYGFGANAEQQLLPWLTAFGRFGWNEGRKEPFAYTEVNQTVSFGVVAAGTRWRRSLDRAGFAFASDVLSGDHRRYLQLGGSGFLLGDGTLTYGREKVIDTFYTVHLWRGVFGSFGLQHINNPGYNRDRGPVLVPDIRLHLDL